MKEPVRKKGIAKDARPANPLSRGLETYLRQHQPNVLPVMLGNTVPLVHPLVSIVHRGGTVTPIKMAVNVMPVHLVLMV